MTIRALASTGFGLVTIAIGIGCGGTSTSPASDGGSDAPVIREPAVHRAAPPACPTDRPAGNAPVPGTCKTDAECTQGTNGRCTSVALAPATCSYDACTVDKDCGGAGVCQCRSSAEGGANACRQGNCRTDGDCGVVGKGYCSPSAVEIDVYCRSGIPSGSFGYFCHTPEDECVSDTDCAGLMPACVFDVAKSRWACLGLACTD
ncbi:hypothetical protein BH09MYX1_BH09MYX1_32520 [soil metagenome]